MKIEIILSFNILAYFFFVWGFFNLVDGVLDNNIINIVKGVWTILLSTYMFIASKGLDLELNFKE